LHAPLLLVQLARILNDHEHGPTGMARHPVASAPTIEENERTDRDLFNQGHRRRKV
jgi:hypothetical protein